MVQVCRSWRAAGEAPGLWTGLCLRATGETVPELQEVLGWRRMLLVRGLRLVDRAPVSEGLLEKVLRHRGLKSLTLQGSDLSSVDPSLLVKIVTGLEELSLGSAGLNCHQIETVLRALNSETTLTRLNLSGNLNLAEVAPSLLAKALERLELLDLSQAVFLPLQIKALFSAAAVQKNLKSLKIGYNNGPAVWLQRDNPFYGVPVYEMFRFPDNAGSVCAEVSQAERGGSLPDGLLLKLRRILLLGSFQLKIENGLFKMVAEKNSCIQTELTCTLCKAIFMTDLAMMYHKLAHIQLGTCHLPPPPARPPVCRNGENCRFHRQQRCKFYHDPHLQENFQGQNASHWTPEWYPVM